MRVNTTKQKLAEGRVVLGGIVSGFSPEIVELLGLLDFDFVFLDCEHGSMSVGEVADHFMQTTGQARTTILTIMERLRKKGYLTRRQLKGVFHYSLKVGKHDFLRGLVRKFVENTLADFHVAWRLAGK